MALTNWTGFESGDAIDGSVTGTTSFVSTGQRSGNWALRCNPTGSAQGYFEFMGLNNQGRPADFANSNFYVSVWLKFDTIPASGSEQFMLMWSRSPYLTLCGLRIKSNGTVELRDAVGNLVATSTTAIIQGRRTSVQFHLSGTSLGPNRNYELKIDGTSEFSGSTSTCGTSRVGKFYVGKVGDVSSQSVDVIVDDMVCDDAGFPNMWLRVGLIKPDGNGNYTAWTGDYTDCDDVPHNSDTDYVSTSSGLASESFDVEEPAAAGVCNSDRVTAVKTRAIGRLSSGSATMQSFIRIGSTDYTSGTATSPTGSYTQILRLDSTNPDTASAWEVSDLDSVEVGVKSGFGFGFTLRCTAANIEILYLKKRAGHKVAPHAGI